MGDFIRLFKLLIAAAIVIPIVLMGSCAAIGVGSVAAVEKVATSAVASELADKAIKQHEEHMKREKNEEFYREADRSIEYDDYGDPM